MQYIENKLPKDILLYHIYPYLLPKVEYDTVMRQFTRNIDFLKSIHEEIKEEVLTYQHILKYQRIKIYHVTKRKDLNL